MGRSGKGVLIDDWVAAEMRRCGRRSVTASCWFLDLGLGGREGTCMQFKTIHWVSVRISLVILALNALKVVQISAKRRGCLLSYSQADPRRELT